MSKLCFKGKYIFLISFILILGNINFVSAVDITKDDLELKYKEQQIEVMKIQSLNNYINTNKKIFNTDNKVKIGQIGNYNMADIKQIGKNNFGWIRQVNDNNSSEIYQVGNTNNGFIAQIGNRNEADITQNNYEGYRFGFIAQIGDENQASISQQGGFNIGVIGQFGNENEVNIFQDGSKIDIEQNGDNNRAGAIAFGQIKNLAIKQYGDNQNIEILSGQ